jgi:tetratricopeptide (TPR) repeat protein
MDAGRPEDTFADIPDPGRARTLDELIEGLRSLKVWAGDPSYEWITRQINGTWTAAGRPAGELTKRPTVADCFKPGRRRLNTDLIIAIAQALHPDVGYVNQWRQALRVIGGETRAAAQVRVEGRLPPDLVGFTGRLAELGQLRQAMRHDGVNGGAVAITIEGMAGVGKTQLAVHAGHILTRERRFDRVLFVNLRGFHPDPAQPPADPAAVLDGFLRLLGVPGQQVPHDLEARATLYRGLLGGIRALVVLDNAASTDQVRPLLPETPGCLTLVTSRRKLTHLHSATHLAVEVFTPDEARAFVAQAALGVPAGEDPKAAARIAHRCGYLPLALGLVAGHIGGTPGWTLTDHADRLDERHHDRRLDTGIELALDLSYQRLPVDRQRLLRLTALHPGHDFDAYAAAALAATDLATARHHLHHLCGDHLLQPASLGRYTFHDLIRAYAAGRAHDDDRPSDRHAVMTRLFDYYLTTAGAAMDTLYPAEAHYRPRIPLAGTPTPDLTGPDTSRGWLDTERPTLVAIAARTATDGWLTHTTQLSTTLFRYLAGGHYADAVTVHGYAHHAAQQSGDPTAQAQALTELGAAHLALGRYQEATDHLHHGLTLYQQLDDKVGQARALIHLGTIEERLGRYRHAANHHEQAQPLHQSASDHFEEALDLFRQADDRTGEADALDNLGYALIQLGRYGSAADHLQRALTLYRQTGDNDGEAWTLDSLGVLHNHLDQPAQATEYHQRALVMFREIGVRDGEAWALNGLGEAARADGCSADAVTYHTAAHTIAADIGETYQHARAHTGLGHAHHTLNRPAHARQHYQRALALYASLGSPHADQIRTYIDATATRRGRAGPSR